MKNAAMNLGVLVVVVALFFFIAFAFAASVYRYSNPKLTETELQIWAILHWYYWVGPLAGFGAGSWLIWWSRK